jgi:hypothetical protein
MAIDKAKRLIDGKRQVGGWENLVKTDVVAEGQDLAPQVIRGAPLRYSPEVTVGDPADLVPKEYVDARRTTRTVDRLFAGAGQTAFELSVTPSDNSLVDAYLNGILLAEGDDYTLVVRNLTLVDSVEQDDRLIIKYW